MSTLESRFLADLSPHKGMLYQVANAYCRIVDASNNKEVARYDLSVQGNHTAQIMAKVYRHNGEWKMHAIGENGVGRTFNELMPQITPHL